MVKRVALNDKQKFEIYSFLENLRDEWKGRSLSDIHKRVSLSFNYEISKSTVRNACANLDITYGEKPIPKPKELKQALKILAKALHDLYEEISTQCPPEVLKIIERF